MNNKPNAKKFLNNTYMKPTLLHYIELDKIFNISFSYDNIEKEISKSEGVLKFYFMVSKTYKVSYVGISKNNTIEDYEFDNEVYFKSGKWHKKGLR